MLFEWNTEHARLETCFKKSPSLIITVFLLAFFSIAASAPAQSPLTIVDGASSVDNAEFRAPDGVYVKTLPLTAARASWSIVDSQGKFYPGVGDDYLLANYTGSVTITWDELANHELPIPPKETKTVSPGNPAIFTGIYTRHSGRVRITATPPEAPWTLTDGDGAVTSGTGSQVLLAVPTGQITIVWHTLPDYLPPAQTTFTAWLDWGKTLPFEEHYTIIQPAPPSNPDPANGEVGVVAATLLRWTAGERAQEYDIYTWVDGSTKPAKPRATVKKPFFDPPMDLVDGRTYHWQVVSINASGEAPGKPWQFTVRPEAPRPTPPPSAVMASDGVFSDKVRVSWKYPTDKAYFRVYRSRKLRGERIKLGAWQQDTFFDDTTPTSSTLYFYFVRAAVNDRGDRASNFLVFDTGWMYAEPDLRVFKITYKNIDIEIEEDGALRGWTRQNRAAKSLGKSTIKIRKLKAMPLDAQDSPGVKYIRSAGVPKFIIKGNISKLYTEAPIRKINIEGEMKNVTLKDTYAEWLVADEIGKVKMSGAKKGFPSADASTLRGIQSRSVDSEAPVASTIIQGIDFDSFRRARIILKGVVLRELTVPGQAVDLVSVFSKKVRDEDGNLKLNIGDIEGGRIEAQNIRTIKTKGGSILPTEILGSSRDKPMKIKGRIGVFTSDRAGKIIMDIRPGNVAPQMMNVQTPKLTMQAVGGDMTPGKIYVSDRIQTMSAKFKKVRRDGILEFHGGHFGLADRDEFGDFLGVTTPTLVVSGVENFPGVDVNIKKVFGAKSVVGIFMAGGSFDASAEFGMKPNLQGSIFKIQTKASEKGEYPAPTIFGQAWSLTPIEYKPEGKPPDFIEFNSLP